MDTQKPDDIPDDIWNVVLEIAAPWVRGATIDREGLSHQIARAIMAERNACVVRTAHLPFPRAIAEALLSVESKEPTPSQSGLLSDKACLSGGITTPGSMQAEADPGDKDLD